MCGRFTLKVGPNVLSKQFLLKDLPNLAARYNIAPSQSVLAVRRDPQGSPNTAFEPRWGLVPSWAKDEKIGYKLINARSETAAGKPSFRAACKARRCLVPASGFFEWKREGQQKQPYLIYPSPHGEEQLGGPCFAFAALWESWQPSRETPALETVTILTTSANAAMEEIHDRMPVIIRGEDQDLWLDPASPPAEADWQRLTRPIPDRFIEVHPVSTKVNSPRNDDPSCIEPVDPPEPFRPRPDDDRQETLF